MFLFHAYSRFLPSAIASYLDINTCIVFTRLRYWRIRRVASTPCQWNAWISTTGELLEYTILISSTKDIDNMRPDTEETELTTQVAQYLTAITMKMITPVLSSTTSPKGIWYWCSHSKALLVMLPRTLFFLMLWSVLPGSIMFLSCVYMCVCSKFMFIGDDGHMRIFCCGKAVTGMYKTFI